MPAKPSIMNEGISVRTCHPKDIDTLVSLAIKTFRDTFDEFNSPENMMRYINKAFARKAVEKEMQQPGTVFFLALDGRKAVGYAKISASTTPPAVDPAALQIDRLYVHQSYLGKRVGYMLMQTCLAHARKKGCPTLWLGVWENNARAIAFYERLGFSRFGQSVFMLGNDAQTDWLMKKELHSNA